MRTAVSVNQPSNSQVDSGGTVDPAPVVSRRPPGTVVFWALLGVVGLVVLIKGWVPWLASGEASQPSPGPDKYRGMAILRATEVLSMAAFVGLFWHALGNPLRKRRGLSLDGKLFLGAFFASSLDAYYASLNPTWSMNAHGVSLGTWANYLPGFANPGQDRSAWGLLWCMPAYIYLGLGAALVGCAMLRRLRGRYPMMPTVALYAVVFAAFCAFDFVLENIWIHHEVYTYVSVPSSLTLWAGSIHQFPLYEPILIAAYCISFTWLRDSRDANDRCAVDRDVDRLQIGHRAKTLLSALAVSGYVAVTTMVAYQVPWSWMSMQAERTSFPVLPSYLQPGQNCGQPGQPLCASGYLDQLRQDYKPPPR